MCGDYAHQQLPFLHLEEDCHSAGVSIRKGRACGIIHNAEVRIEGVKPLCNIEFKERRKGVL